MRGDIVEIGECISLVATRPCASGVHLDCVSFPVVLTVGAGSLEPGAWVICLGRGTSGMDPS